MEDKSLKELVLAVYKDFRKYLDLKLDYYKLDLIERAVLLLTKIFSFAVIWIIVTMIAFFLSMGTAFLIGDLLDSTYLGFFIVAGIILIVGLIILAIRKPLITNPIINALIKAVFNPERRKNEKTK